MKPEQAKQIEADAPEGATHFDIDDDLHIKYKPEEQAWYYFNKLSEKWCLIDEVDELCFMHALSDLRTIVEQAERIEALEELGKGYLSLLSALVQDGYLGYIDRKNKVRELLGE